jgi:large subunit ribosomal protein L30
MHRSFEKNNSRKMIAVIRIHGLVGLNEKVEETLFRMRLRRKFSCVVFKENKEIEGMLRKVDNFVAYGKIDEKTLQELVEKRGQGDKKDVKKVIEEIEKGKIKSIKPFFRLHPPRGGLKSSKKRFPKGVLGKNEKINELIMRML